MMWELKLDFQDGSVPVTVANPYIMADSFEPKWCVGAKGGHQTQSLHLRIASRSIAARLATGAGRVNACLYKDDVPFFTGVVRNNVSLIASSDYESPAQVELLDSTDLLHRYVYSREQLAEIIGDDFIQEQTFIGSLPYLDPQNISGSILGKLFALVGISAITTTLSIPSQGDMEYVVSAGSYVDELINDICYQFLCDYRFHADGSVEILSTEPPATEPLQTISTSDLINQFKVEKKDDDTDGTTVEYSEYKEAKHLLVVPEAGYSRQSGNLLSIWREWKETNKTVYWDFSCLPADGDKNKTIVAVENITLGYDTSEGGGHESDATFSISSHDLEKCVFSHKVNVWWEWVGAWIKARLYADVRYRQSGFKAYGRTGRNPKKYTSELIHSYEDAMRLGDAMYRYVVGSQFRYTFSSFKKYDPGTFWTLAESTVSGVGQVIRIISCTVNMLSGVYAYEAEGIDCAKITAPPNSLEMADIAAMEFGGAPGLTIKAGQTIFSENSDLYAVYTASGYYIEYYHLPVSWTIDDTPIPAGQLLGVDAIRIPVQSVSVGNHIVKCSCDISSILPGEPVAMAASRLSVVGDGKDGEPGPQGAQGTAGATGDTLYTWLKYADTPTSGMSDSSDGKKYIGLAYNKTTPTESTAYSDYTWSLIKGDKGETGAVGQTGAKGDKGDTGSTGKGISSIVEHYAVSTSNSTTPTSWATTMPTLTATNKYLWNYTRYTYTDGTSVDTAKIVIGTYGDKGDTGTTGATGPAPIIQYRYSDKSVVPPQGVNYVVSGDGNYVTWNGNRVAFDEESSWGESSVPLPGMPFKWMRVSLDNGTTWKYSIIEQPVADFFLEAYPAPYGMSSRNVVKTAQTVTIACDRQNTSGATSWSVNRGLAIVPSGDSTTAAVTIPVGFGYTSFTVSCSVAGVGTKTIQVNGVPAGAYVPMFLGKLETAPATTDEGPLMAGDSYLTSGNVPKRWDGYGWNPPTASDSNYAFIMSQSLNAVLADGTDVTQSMASLYAWIGELAAKSATIQRLFAKNVTVGNGDGTASSGFRFRAHQYDANGNLLAVPIFDIMYGDKTVWKVVPSTGKIFFGQPNAALDAPLTGFMYDPSMDTIRTANDKVVIDSTGKIIAVDLNAANAELTGNSVFSGLFNCMAIKTLPSKSISTAYVQTGNANQCKNLVNDIGASNGDVLRCSVVGGNSEVEYMRVEISGYWSSGYYVVDQWLIKFLDKNYNPVACGFSVTDTFNSYSTPGTVLISYRGYGVWVTNGITLNIYTGGNILVVSIPSGPTESEIASFESGQVYRDANGFLKCTPITS